MATITNPSKTDKTDMTVREFLQLDEAQRRQVAGDLIRVNHQIWTPAAWQAVGQMTVGEVLARQMAPVLGVAQRVAESHLRLGEALAPAMRAMKNAARTVEPFVKAMARAENLAFPRFQIPEIIIPSAFTEAMRFGERMAETLRRVGDMLVDVFPRDGRAWGLLLMHMAEQALEESDVDNVDAFLSYCLGVQDPGPTHHRALYEELQLPGPWNAEEPLKYLRFAVLANVRRYRNEREQWERLFWDKGPGGGVVIPLEQPVNPDKPDLLLVDQIAQAPAPNITGDVFDAVMDLLSPEQQRVVRYYCFNGGSFREAAQAAYPGREPRQLDNVWINIRRKVKRHYPDMTHLL